MSDLMQWRLTDIKRAWEVLNDGQQGNHQDFGGF